MRRKERDKNKKIEKKKTSKSNKINEKKGEI